jgi:uncharacterized protein (TIGR02594 family)
MIAITASVGRHGANRPTDVRVVQHLLNANSNSAATQRPLAVDGQCGAKTIAAIETFQRRALRVLTPDGVIAPDGATMRVLKTVAGTYPLNALAQPAWLVIANAEEGTHERPGLAQNEPRILEYLATFPALGHTPLPGDAHDPPRMMGQVDETPWCACFVNFCLERAGCARGPSPRARDWLHYGTACAAQPGAIAVLYRKPFNDSATGWHVGFWIGGAPAFPALLGGNQDNRVGRKQFYGLEQLHFRWP